MSGQLGDDLAAIFRRGFAPPIPTGFEFLDRVTRGGLRRGEVSVVAAKTGHGKTAFLEQMALWMSMTSDVLFMPLEMGAEKALIRMGAKLARCDEDSFLRTGADRMTVSELNSRELHLHAPEDELFYVDDLLDTVARMRCPVVIVDHVRHIEGWFGTDQDGHKSATGVVRKIERGARELGVHIVLCQQIARPKGPRAIKRPAVDQLQDTSALEQAASLIILIHRPFYLDGAERDTVSVIEVAKNRHGPLCKSELRWVGPTMSVWPLAEGEVVGAKEIVESDGDSEAPLPVEPSPAATTLDLDYEIGRAYDDPFNRGEYS